MPTSIVFAVAAAAFLLLAVVRLIRDHGRLAPAARIWLLIGAVFAVVAASLFMNR
jgi:hypothetical protein